MQEILALTLQSMQQDMQRLDRIGSNMANALTPGYQRDVMSSQPVGVPSLFASMVGGRTVSSQTSMGAARLEATSTLAIQTDMRPGSLKSTGQPLDLALSRSGYFEVQTATGPAYTRQGNFHVDARGRLVNAQDLPVMGKGGEIYLNGGHPFIDNAGNVFESEAAATARGTDGRAVSAQAVAQLKIVESDDPTSLERMGNGLMTGRGQFSAMKDADFEVRQGFLETSNVSSMQEMVQLMQTMRHFESMQKVVQGYDDMTSQAVRKLGELS